MRALNNDPSARTWTTGSDDTVRQRNSWVRYLRRPTRSDAIAMHRLVAETGVLDVNSTYAYILLATDFADTTIVADRGDDLCGLITAYHPPTRPEVLFVWQVAVAHVARGTGLAGTMLDTLVHRVRKVRHGHPITIETTVAPGNAPSRALFGAFARRHRVPLTEQPHFSAAHLDADEAHDDEPLLRIGPLTTTLTD